MRQNLTCFMFLSALMVMGCGTGQPEERLAGSESAAFAQSTAPQAGEATIVTQADAAVGQRFSAVVEGSRVPSPLRALAARDNSVVGEYFNGVDRVRFETRRGGRTQSDLRSDPGAPEFEIDVRLIDDQGFPFYVQFGGHGPIDSEWTDAVGSLQANLVHPSDQKAIANFAAAERAMEALARVELRAGLSHERKALLGVGTAIREAIAMDTVDYGSQTGVGLDAANYAHKLSVYKGSAAWGIAGAEHSATRATEISPSGVVTQIWSASNHGRAWYQSGMSFYDSWTSAANRYPLGAISWPQCGTPYGIVSGKHVCNDDSVVQCMSLKTLSSPGNPSTCSDSYLRMYAPRCD